jgi:hypothetical protein
VNGLALCVIAAGLTFWAGKKSLGLGIVVLLTFAYFYGIIRANILSTSIYFLFDSVVVALYLSQKWSNSNDVKVSRALRTWMILLMIWPCLLVLMPFQPLLVSLVGLRGAIFFLPMALLGNTLRSRDVYHISLALAFLNLAVLGFAAAEYFQGLPRYYPVNAVTIIIYASSDVAGGFYRIPGTFVNAHGYGGMMVATIPYLLGAWEHSRNRVVRILMVAGIGAAMLGVLLSATRLNFVIGTALVVLSIWKVRMKPGVRAIFVALILAMTLVALRNERFQRFKSLSDSDLVRERISGSVNRGFFEILATYPLGNGLGGGGTSVPFFLEGQVRHPVATENEYARIMCEQGVIGLMLWIGFILWFLGRYRTAFAIGPWATTRRMTWISCVIGLFSAMIGNGMLTAIPGSAMLLLSMGFATSPVSSPAVPPRRTIVQRAFSPQRLYRPIPTFQG